MKRAIHRSPASLLLMTLVISSCDAGGGSSAVPIVAGDKAGGRAPTVLTLGTDDIPGDASSDYTTQFAADLDRISGGLVTVEIKYRAAGERGLRFDQRIAEMVLAGDLDLGLTPTRAFDELGVTSLQALQAPFLLTDDEAMDAVVSSELGDDLMSGLPSAGYEGLALWPEALRHPYSFGAPILTLSDFDGLLMRVPVSKASFDLLEALGARPHDLADVRPDDDAAETGIRTIANIGRPGVVTGNITFFPKIQMLFANGSAFARLTDEERRLVREAAAATSMWVGQHREREETAVAMHCGGGGILVLATPRDEAEIVAAAAPVYAELEADPLTKRLIGDIRDIVAAPRDQQPFAPRPCGSIASSSPSPSTSPEPTDDPSVLNGVYRADISASYLESKGINPTEAFLNGGIFTLTFQDGRFTHHLDRDGSSCNGPYTVTGSRVRVTVADECGTFDPLFSATWTVVDGELRFIDIEPRGDLLAQASWGGKPFSRIGDAP